MPIEIEPTARTRAGRAVKLVGGLLLLAGIILVLWHAFLWLRDGVWPSYPASRMLLDIGLPSLAIDSPWVRGPVAWLLGWSAAGLLTLCSIVLVFAGAMLTDSHDTQMEARAKARAMIIPSAEPENSTDRTVSQISGSAMEEATPEVAMTGVAAAPSWRRRMADNLLSLGCVVVLGAVLFGLGWAWTAFDSTHYDSVTAQVRSVGTACELEWEAIRDPGIFDKAGRQRSEAMPCDQARARAPSANPRVVEVRNVAYSYVSPVDGRTYSGSLHADALHLPDDLHAGGEIQILSLTADPARSRLNLDEPLSPAASH
jgi:hypothetical protein